MTKALPLGGHRGFGCTDHAFFQSVRPVDRLPVENTLESVEAAFQAGADYVEIDAVMSADGCCFVLHSVVPEEHFFMPERPAGLLNMLPYESGIAPFRTGRSGQGRVASLSEMLALAAALDPGTLPWALNVEVKGVQGSGQPFEAGDFLVILADTVRRSPLPVERILFSSFALENILSLSHLLPQARYGMLFATDLRPAYADSGNNHALFYLPFTVESVDFVTKTWVDQANPSAKLGFFHPEFSALDKGGVELSARHKAGLNTWSFQEEITPARLKAYQQVQAMAEERGVPLTVITDDLAGLTTLP